MSAQIGTLIFKGLILNKDKQTPSVYINIMPGTHVDIMDIFHLAFQKSLSRSVVKLDLFLLKSLVLFVILLCLHVSWFISCFGVFLFYFESSSGVCVQLFLVLLTLALS